MGTVICSMFRDSTGYLDRYFDQVDQLADLIDVRLCVAEGDSTDDTYTQLAARIGAHDQLLKVDIGGRKWGSVDHVQRWTELAQVGNAILEAVDPDGPVIWVESDLIWDPGTMLALIDLLEQVPAVAPMCFQDGAFYDVWGHRGVDGVRFSRTAPYHASLTDTLTEIGSAGSCVVMRPDVAKVSRFGENDCIVGLGRSIRENGFSLWVDPHLSVRHP